MATTVVGKKQSVSKKGTKYAVVKEVVTYKYDWGGTFESDHWYVVDIASGTIIKEVWSASDGKAVLASLESGLDAPTDYATSWNNQYGSQIDLPPSLQQAQKQLLKPPSAKASKPIGSTSASVTSVTDKGTYSLLEFDDGTYGAYIPSTGSVLKGYKKQGGMNQAVKKAVKGEAESQLSAMGLDPGSDAVDTLIGTYETRLRALYESAYSDMADAQAKYLREFEAEKAKMLERVSSGEITREQYDSWLAGQAGQAKWYKDMVSTLSGELAETDRTAMSMLNGYLPQAYAENFNFGTYQIESGTSISTSFSLYDKGTVLRLAAQEDQSLLPKPSVDIAKDELWSRQKISSATAQSILMGESTEKAAARLQRVVGMSANSAMRAARTAFTGAQNAGRVDSYKRALSLGIDLEQQWLATPDERTRYSHREIDMEHVKVGEKFSNGLRYPGDPEGSPEEVYNCRCTLIPYFNDVVDPERFTRLPSGMTYDDWKNEHMTKLAANADKLQAQLDEATAKMGELKKLMPEDKDFGKIVQEDAHASAWTPEKVASSEEFYFKKLQKAIAENNEFDIKWYKDRLAQLKEYDDAGRAYAEAKKLVEPELERWKKKADELKTQIAKLKPNPNGAANAYTDERKSNARRWSSPREAHGHLKGWCEDVWSAASGRERDGIRTYTGSAYTRYNRPLNGYANGSYSLRNFMGVGNVDINEEGYGDGIRAMTSYIQSSIVPEDMWTRRGTTRNEVAQFFGVSPQELWSMDEQQLDGLVGHSARIGAFQSTFSAADASGQPFDNEVAIYYFIPQGAQAAYVDPHSLNPGEYETILQRGGSYTCTEVKRERYGMRVVLEVHPEDGYDLFQQ